MKYTKSLRVICSSTLLIFIFLGCYLYFARHQDLRIESSPESATRMNAAATVAAVPTPAQSGQAMSQEAPQQATDSTPPSELQHQRFRELKRKAILHSQEQAELAQLTANPQLAARHFAVLKNGAAELERMQAIDWLESALKYQEPSLREETAQQILALLADPALAQLPDGNEFRSQAGDRIELALVLITQVPTMRAAALQAVGESGLQGLAKIVKGRSATIGKD